MKALVKMKNPFKRLAQLEDVANMLALLAIAESTWINGIIIHVDGSEKIGGL